MEAKVRPGRFNAQCSNCEKSFILVVEEEGGKLRVRIQLPKPSGAVAKPAPKSAVKPVPKPTAKAVDPNKTVAESPEDDDEEFVAKPVQKPVAKKPVADDDDVFQAAPEDISMDDESEEEDTLAQPSAKKPVVGDKTVAQPSPKKRAHEDETIAEPTTPPRKKPASQGEATLPETPVRKQPIANDVTIAQPNDSDESADDGTVALAPGFSDDRTIAHESSAEVGDRTAAFTSPPQAGDRTAVFSGQSTPIVDDEVTQVMSGFEMLSKDFATLKKQLKTQNRTDVTDVLSRLESQLTSLKTQVESAASRGGFTQLGHSQFDTGDTHVERGKADDDLNMPKVVGGYQVVKQLGRGGMGAVFLARQMSLDRNVALKVMNPSWADDATFLARFTREAYAAAQLTHHNIVQIYDIGSQARIHFFSMEFVEGQSLNDLLKKEGKLDADVAVGFVLQAARGLKFVHERGMIHRDIKPDNIMINNQGVVKVADLGLVKTPGSVDDEPNEDGAEDKKPKKKSAATDANLTQVNMAMGTPAYMSPEQATNAAAVDARADIYSLGCTLYTLLTGRPPFTGKSAQEIMTKHIREPMTPPEVVVKRVPKELSGLVLKMTAKKLENRYQNMGEAIKALEKYAGVTSASNFSPREEHLDELEAAVREYNTVPAVGMRKTAIMGLLGLWVCAILMPLFLASNNNFYIAGCMLAPGLTGMLAYIILAGTGPQQFLFSKVRELVFASSWLDWLTWIGGVLLFVGLLWLLKMFTPFFLLGAVGVGVACGIYYGIDTQLEIQRTDALARIEKLLKMMRIQGLEEEAVQQFVYKYAGNEWEEVYEKLFGYENKLYARKNWGALIGSKNRPKFGGWRDSAIEWLDTRIKEKRFLREVRTLMAVEMNNLMAKGLNKAEARRRAWASAQAMVEQAAEFKNNKGSLRNFMNAAARPDKYRKRRSISLMGIFNKLLSPKLRFIAGALLILASVLSSVEIGKKIAEETVAAQNAPPPDPASLPEPTIWSNVPYIRHLDTIQKDAERVLVLPYVPDEYKEYTSFTFQFHPALAGVLLILSSMLSSWRAPFLLLPGAIVTLVGHMFLPAAGLPLSPPILTLAFGAAVFVLSCLIGMFSKR
jgi:serine/threonine protein kinase